jgi:hypothetical protein
VVLAGTVALGLLGVAEQLGRIGDSYSSAAAVAYHQRVAAAIPASCESFLLAPEKTVGMLSRSQFDSAAYLAANPDVAKAWPGTAWEHYAQFGFREGRPAFSRSPVEGGLIRREEFDDAKYLAANPDLASAWRGAPWEHYVRFGYREGRSLDPNEAAQRRWENFHYQITGLVVSAISGKPTVNGASGLSPIGYPLSNVLVLDVQQTLARWLRKFPDRRACLIKMPLPPAALIEEARTKPR